MEQQLENLLEVNSLYLNHSNNNKGRVAYSFAWSLLGFILETEIK